MKPYIDILRPINCLMMGLAVIIGGLISYGSITLFYDKAFNLFLGFLTGFFLTASSMVLNDYIDREIDLVNEPSRPIPSGKIKPIQAVVYSILLGTIGLIVSIPLGIEAFVVALITYFVAVSYNIKGKKTGLLGNMMVSYTVMIPLIFGALTVGEFNQKIAIFSLIIFLANTGREITKGIIDITGDRLKNIRTVAVKYGAKTASAYAGAFYFSAIILSFLPYIAELTNKYYLYTVLIVDIIIGYSTIKLIRNPTKDVARKVKTRILYAMLLGLIAFGLSTL